MSDDRLAQWINAKLHGGTPPEPYPSHVARDHDAEMRSWIDDRLHERGYKFAADLRAEDRARAEQAAQQPAGVGDEALAAMLDGLSSSEREAWDALIPEIQEAALRGDPAALETWGAVERSIVRGVPLAEIALDEEGE